MANVKAKEAEIILCRFPLAILIGFHHEIRDTNTPTHIICTHA